MIGRKLKKTILEGGVGGRVQISEWGFTSATLLWTGGGSMSANGVGPGV